MKKFYQLNQYIRADKLRVIDPDGKQLGVISRDEALFKARQIGLDLVLVAEKANPPVAKIIDFKKLRYQEAKKQQISKKKKTQEQKEIRFTPFIAKNDFEIRIRRAKKFLKEGSRVKLSVRFRGVQLARKQFGYDLLKKAASTLAEMASLDREPKFVGRILSTTLVPKKKNEKKQNEDQKVGQKKV